MSWPDDLLDIRIRIALDADRSVDWTTWDWTDISEYGREAGKITSAQGDADEFGETPPATCTLRLDNTDGRFTRRKPDGPYYGRFGRNTPIWIEVDSGSGYETRFIGEVAEWPKSWDISATDATVPIECAGVSRRISQNDVLARSAATGYLTSTSPVALWPLEDGEDAATAASALPGGLPMVVARSVMDFVTDAPPGAAGSAKPVADAGNALIGVVAGASSSAWQVSCWTMGAPSNDAADAYYIPLEIRTSTNQIFRFVMQHDDDVSMPAVGVGHYDDEDDTAATNFIGWFDPNPVNGFYSKMGEWTLIQFVCEQVGGNVNVALYVDGTLEDSALWMSVTAGAPVRINAPGRFGGIFGVVSENMADVWLSQIAVHNGSTVVDQHEAGIGWPGEPAGQRIERLFAAAGIPVRVLGSGDTEPMGVQGPGTLMALARAGEAADGGGLQDDPTEPGMLYIPRVERYNLTPWELDYDTADMGGVPESTDDDQRIGNQVTATRPSGGSYVARDEEDIAAYGIVVDDPISPAVWQDSQLPHQAGWRLHLDQVDEDRWPRIPINLRRRPELIPDWVAVVPGATRARISNMPAQAGPDPVDVIIEGWTETISQVEWRADLFCSPASPWTVGVIEDDELGRADTDGSRWVGSFATGTDTSELAVVTAGPPWINSTDHAAMFPFNIRSSGVVLSVTGIAASAADTFGRSVGAGGWGTATTGQSWSVTAGTAANCSVTGSVGRVALTATNDIHLLTLDAGSVDADPITEVVIPVVPTGAPFTIRSVTRATDAANYYYTELTIGLSGVATVKLFKRVSNTATQLGSSVTLSATHGAGDRWVVQCSAIGPTIRARAWKSTAQPERGWYVTATDTALTTGTRIGVAARRETSNTNGSQNVDFDNFAAPSLQTFTFDATPVNGVVKTVSAGEPLSLASPWRLAQ